MVIFNQTVQNLKLPFLPVIQVDTGDQYGSCSDCCSQVGPSQQSARATVIPQILCIMDYNKKRTFIHLYIPLFKMLHWNWRMENRVAEDRHARSVVCYTITLMNMTSTSRAHTLRGTHTNTVNRKYNLCTLLCCSFLRVLNRIYTKTGGCGIYS